MYEDMKKLAKLYYQKGDMERANTIAKGLFYMAQKKLETHVPTAGKEVDIDEAENLWLKVIFDESSDN